MTTVRKKRETVKSDAGIRALKPAKDSQRLPVHKVPDLFVTVSASGGKSFAFRYRVLSSGHQKLFTFGSWPAWSLPAAKIEVKRLRRLVDAGGDPKGELEAVRALPLVGALLDAYLKSDTFASKAATTRLVDTGRIERHLRPTLGRRRVDELKLTDIQKAAADITAGKTAVTVKTKPRGLARVRGGTGTANEAIKLLRSILSWAVTEGLTEHHPAKFYKVAAAGTRETILDGADAYGRLFKTLDKMESERRIRPSAADAIRLIALTGARRGEIVNLRWKHVELKQGRIVLPPSEHKTGKSTGKPRIIGLPAVAMAIIARQPAGTAGAADDLVFTPAGGNGGISLSKLWRTVRQEAGLPENIGLHGLRHSTASHLAMAGSTAVEIAAVLGHRQLSTVQRYVHFAENAQAKLAERAAATAVAGMTAGKSDGDVLQLRRPSR